MAYLVKCAGVMDKLSLKFAQEAALRQIDECSSITEIKELAKSLMKAHFQTRTFIADLMLRDLPKTEDVLEKMRREL